MVLLIQFLSFDLNGNLVLTGLKFVWIWRWWLCPHGIAQSFSAPIIWKLNKKLTCLGIMCVEQQKVLRPPSNETNLKNNVIGRESFISIWLTAEIEKDFSLLCCLAPCPAQNTQSGAIEIYRIYQRSFLSFCFFFAGCNTITFEAISFNNSNNIIRSWVNIAFCLCFWLLALLFCKVDEKFIWNSYKAFEYTFTNVCQSKPVMTLAFNIMGVWRGKGQRPRKD